MWLEHVIHERLEGCWGIGEAQRHDEELLVEAMVQRLLPIPLLLPLSSAQASNSFSENSLSICIIAFKLTGQNFIPWSQSIQMLIHDKGKIGYLDGSTPQPPKDVPSFNNWEINNSLVMSWLIHSMDSR